MKTKESFIQLIEQLLKRPAIYNINRVEDLEHIFFGYQHALFNNEKDSGEELKNILADFRKKINEHFNSKIDSSWVRLIRFNSGTDKHSIELFSQLFEMYLK